MDSSSPPLPDSPALSPTFSPSYPSALSSPSFYRIPATPMCADVEERCASTLYPYARCVLVLFPDFAKTYIFPLQEALADDDLWKLPSSLHNMFTHVENFSYDIVSMREEIGEGIDRLYVEKDVSRVLLLVGMLLRKGWCRDCESDSFPSDRFLISATWTFRGIDSEFESLRECVDVYAYWEFEYASRAERHVYRNNSTSLYSFQL